MTSSTQLWPFPPHVGHTYCVTTPSAHWPGPTHLPGHTCPPPPPRSSRPLISLTPSPLAPHSAGVGRTGCFIVIDAMLERIKPEKTVDVYGHVTLMRSQRNYMVQTEDQYSFIHEALLEAVGCGNTEVPARSLYAYIQKLAQVEPGEHVTGMELEFKVGQGGRPVTSLPPSVSCPTPGPPPLTPAPRPSARSGWPIPKLTRPASSVPTCLVISSRTA